MIRPSTGACAVAHVVQRGDVRLRDQQEMHGRDADGCRGTPARRRPRTPCGSGSRRARSCRRCSSGRMRSRRHCIARTPPVARRRAHGLLAAATRRLFVDSRRPVPALELREHVVGRKPVPGEQHQAVEPEVGDFVRDAGGYRRPSPPAPSRSPPRRSSSGSRRRPGEQRCDVGGRGIGALARLDRRRDPASVHAVAARGTLDERPAPMRSSADRP